MSRTEKHPAYLEAQAILQWAEETQGNGHQIVFYLPSYSSNVTAFGGTVSKVGVPEGYELDVEAWNSAGRRGAAPIRLKQEPEPVPEEDDEPEQEFEPLPEPLSDTVWAEVPDAVPVTEEVIAPVEWKPRKRGG